MDVVSHQQSVGELMTRDPIVTTIDVAVGDVADLMDFYRVSGVPVVDWDGSLLGVISQMDLVQARSSEALWRAWDSLTVGDLMTRPAATIHASAPIEDAVELMKRLRIHRLVVVAGDGETPIGVLSVTDVVHAIAERPES
jgi:CBS domain-containing protein